MENKQHIINLDFLGGAMEVGASAVLVEISGKKILLDSGIRQKAGADPLPDFARIQERGGIDAIIVSHAHMDHTGSLPVISKAYPLAPIYATSMTIDLTRVLLYDSIKLMNRQEEGIPVYVEKDVESTLNRMMAVHYEQPLEILPGITLTMYQAGHIAGAACIYLQSKDGSLFYSGDFSSFSQNTIEGIRIPRLRPDIAIVESTYGDRLHSNRQAEERRLIETAAECVEKRGKMLIPVFALGRAQEVLLILRRAMNKGELPKTRIYVDGMVRDMNIAYSRNPWYLKNALAKRIEKGNDVFYSDEIVPVPKNANRDELFNTSEPVIFVSSSGMLTGGPSVEYAKKIAPMENGYIVITGYQDEEAPGRQIMKLLDTDSGEERFLTLDGTHIPVHCTLRNAGLSAHGDKNEISSLLTSLSARNVFLVHGDPEVIRSLASDLDLDYRTRIFTPVCGQTETVYLKSPRQQLKKNFPYTMQRMDNLNDREKEFYQYLTFHYPGRKFTLTDLSYIWYGKHDLPEEIQASFAEAVSCSRFFARDARRLYLFVCRTEEDLREEKMKDSVMTQQKLQTIAEQCFAGFPYRKIGYYDASEEVRFTFDFPQEIADRFEASAEDFHRQTGWTAVRNLEPNEHAMQTLLQKYLGSAILKISIRKAEEQVHVKLSREVDPENLKTLLSEFERLTGYFLTFDGGNADTVLCSRNPGSGFASETGGSSNNPESSADFIKSGSPVPVPSDSFFLPGDSEMREQNLAFSLIDMEFAGTRHAPYKKSIMSDQNGKYIQLAFLSPAIGNLEAERLKSLARQTGWRLKIAQSVNQNAISAIAVQLCRKHHVELKKLPSYQPASEKLVLKPYDGDAGIFALICAEIQEQTGIICEIN